MQEVKELPACPVETTLTLIGDSTFPADICKQCLYKLGL